MSVLLSSRLIKYVKDTFKNILNIESIHVWSDNQATLQWIHTTKPLPVFNQNRVDEIRENLPDANYHYVPSKDNPADGACRGANIKYLFSNLWLKGPPWITDQSQWPVWTESPTYLESNNLINISDINVNNNILEIKIDSLFNLEDYSSLNKVYRITALVLRFVTNLKNSCKKLPLFKSSRKPLFSHNFTIDEMSKAETFWIQNVQQQYYEPEISCLKFNSSFTQTTKIFSLRLVENILRCNLRLHNSSHPYETKFPIFLPCKSSFVNLLIWKYHNDYHHVGISELINFIRHKFYFSRMRQTLRKILKSCVLCKRLQAIFLKQASIKTNTGIITRAIIHLYPLEIYSNTHNSYIEETSATLNSFQRPTRRAKIVARQRIKNIITEEN
ncbi:UNVERIFIED_CONTAM: hypothetical protein RMT77_008350 [Armadillidium vulgare]